MTKENNSVVTIFLRRNLDGKVVAYTSQGLWDFADEFQWAENNYRCDCNRALFWARAQGLPDPDVECGDTAYSARVVAGDETVIYQDGEWE